MSDFEFNKLGAKYSLVFLPFDGIFSQDVGENLLVDGDMEAADTSAWNTAAAPVLAKETSGALFKPTINVGIVGYQYHWFGVGRGDGNTSPRIWNGSYLWNGSSSTSWQSYDVNFTAGSAEFRFYNVGSAGLVGFDANYIYEHPSVIRSLSKQSNALNYARFGDGHSTSVQPTQLPTRGLSFDGGDYLTFDWSSNGYLDTQTFTVLIYARPNTITSDSTLYEIGIAGQRYSLYFDYSETSTKFWKDDTTDQTASTTKGFPDGQHHIYAITNSFNGMKLYIDGEEEAYVNGDVRLSNFDSSSVCYVGQDVSGSNNYNGNIYGFAIYPFELSRPQIREWGRRAKQMRDI